MSEFCLYLRLPRYVGQWCRRHFGDPVRFPARSYPNLVILQNVRPLPRLARPQLPADGLTAVCIPDSRQKPARANNYLTRAAMQEVVSSIDDYFATVMYRELLPMVSSPKLNAGIEHWCHANGITEDSWEAVRQRFYRMRRSLNDPVKTPRGRYLVKKTKKRSQKRGKVFD